MLLFFNYNSQPVYTITEMNCSSVRNSSDQIMTQISIRVFDEFCDILTNSIWPLV